MKRKSILTFFLFFHSAAFFGAISLFSSDLDSIFLELKEERKIQLTPLPIIYNTNFVTGHLNMPSANVAEMGMNSLGYVFFPPYQNIGLNFQFLTCLEGSFNYKIFNNKPEEQFGQYGFGDDADRMANIKFSFDPMRYFSKNLPKVALGFDDFYGSQRFFSPYLVMTQVIPDKGLEFSLGYGFKRMKGPFFGVNYSPFLKSKSLVLRGSTFILEYDDIDYENHSKEHPEAREVFSRFNLGYNFNISKLINLKIATNRGNNFLFQTDVHYNFGETLGLFPKVGDPPEYNFPKNYQSIGELRSEKEAAYEFSNALGSQGFYVTQIYLVTDKKHDLGFQIDLINIRYWRNQDVKERIFAVIKSLFPKNLSFITVTINENSIPIESYTFTPKILDGISKEIPVIEAVKNPSPYEGKLLFNRRKTVASWLIRPRLLSFFGSTTGKYKYALSIILGPQGYLLDKIYYKLLLSYNIKSSIQNLTDIDFYDPSQLLNVRSDSVRYFQSQTVSLEQAYLQAGWNLGKGFYFRTALGYFEPAYAGLALEGLYFPVKANFALGLEAATVLKRNYEGLGFQWKIRKLNHFTPEYVPFVGVQYFLDAYYFFQPFQMEFKVSLGQFLAKDKGVEIDIAKYYPSGLRIGYWMTITNAHDTVHDKVYYNKGISFRLPLDVFLTKSSRNFLGYGVAFWLRDSGAKASTGKELYPTLIRAREY